MFTSFERANQLKLKPIKDKTQLQSALTWYITSVFSWTTTEVKVESFITCNNCPTTNYQKGQIQFKKDHFSSITISDLTQIRWVNDFYIRFLVENTFYCGLPTSLYGHWTYVRQCFVQFSLVVFLIWMPYMHCLCECFHGREAVYCRNTISSSRESWLNSCPIILPAWCILQSWQTHPQAQGADGSPDYHAQGWN